MEGKQKERTEKTKEETRLEKMKDKEGANIKIKNQRKKIQIILQMKMTVRKDS